MKVGIRSTIVAVLFFASCGSVLADWQLDFVRISCIPEARFLRLEHVDLYGGDALLEAEFDEKLRRQRMNNWRKHGFYSPSNLNIECKLPESTYRVTATQPKPAERGICGAAPQITLSLTQNGKEILDQVIFGDACSGEPTVSRVTIFDGLGGWDTQNMTLCMRPKGDRSVAEVCKYLSEKYSDISKTIPIKQENIANYVNNENANK